MTAQTFPRPSRTPRVVTTAVYVLASRTAFDRWRESFGGRAIRVLAADDLRGLQYEQVVELSGWREHYRDVPAILQQLAFLRAIAGPGEVTPLPPGPESDLIALLTRQAREGDEAVAEAARLRARVTQLEREVARLRARR